MTESKKPVFPQRRCRLPAHTPGAVIALLLFFLASCRTVESRSAWSAADLVSELARLEKESRTLDGEAAKRRLEAFARKALGRRVDVVGATVVSTYTRDREWHTRPYFALTSDRSGYVYLDELDPDFHADLAAHPSWASVAQTTAGRQLMFELAVSARETSRLQPGCRLDFSCTLAAVIRGGRSVYCRAESLDVVECDADS